ncbi:AAA family ATPase [Candidatus Peregrinibacteria bacterium]|nr:AAA family ATPase [Candidatus Peregrinibacteria bacterium]
MKLVFLYGPPAVGKLTVAKELSKLTGFKIFHNHLTVDLIETFFEWGSTMFDLFITKYRLELLEAAAEHSKRGLIFTYVFADSRYDHSFVESVVKKIEKHGGSVYFVQLVCDRTILRSRVKDSSRKQYGKIKTVRALDDLMNKSDLFSAIAHRKSFLIDTSKLSAKKVARQIRQHYGI